MSLKQKLSTIKPRENGGSIASNRFDFQKDWAICKLIELSKSNSDFILAFEFHEDIVVFDSSTNPNFIDFYQIKSKKTGKFNLNMLLSKQKLKDSEGNSILGKLLNNKINFDTETKSLNIISNTAFKFKENLTSEKTNICCDELTKEEKEKIATALTSELSIKWVNDFLMLIHFNVSDLTIEHHNEITKAKLNSLIEHKFSSDIKYNPSLAYRTIFDEINRRNNLEKTPESFEELIKYKAVTKDDFERILKIVITEPNKLEILKNKIFTALDSSGIKIGERKKLIDAWKDVEIEILKINNTFFNQCKSIINKVLNDNLSSLDKTIVEVIDILFELVNNDATVSKQKIYSEHFIKLLILIEVYNE